MSAINEALDGALHSYTWGEKTLGEQALIVGAARDEVAKLRAELE